MHNVDGTLAVSIVVLEYHRPFHSYPYNTKVMRYMQMTSQESIMEGLLGNLEPFIQRPEEYGDISGIHVHSFYVPYHAHLL